jgi:hypothetical protein
MTGVSPSQWQRESPNHWRMWGGKGGLPSTTMVRYHPWPWPTPQIIEMPRVCTIRRTVMAIRSRRMISAPCSHRCTKPR